MIEETPLENGNNQEEQESLREVEEMLREVDAMEAKYHELPSEHPIKKSVEKTEKDIEEAEELGDKNLVAKLKLKRDFLISNIGGYLKGKK